MCSPLKASDLARQIYKAKGKSLIEMGLGEGIELDALGLVPLAFVDHILPIDNKLG
jgi:hypothetical protein